MDASVVASSQAIPYYADFAEPVLTHDRELVDLVASAIHPLVRALAGGGHYGSHGVWPHIPGVDAVARTRDDNRVDVPTQVYPLSRVAEAWTAARKAAHAW
jgi:hypothetical protein